MIGLACCKGCVIAGNDDTPNAVIFLHLPEMHGKFAADVYIKSIAYFWPVDPHQSDTFGRCFAQGQRHGVVSS